MKPKSFLPLFAAMMVLSSLFLQTGMSRRGEYDEEARAQERLEKAQRKESGESPRVNPIKRMFGGVKQATVDSAAGLVSETSEGTREDAAVIGTLEGARQGSERVLDNTVKGVSKVATLGYGEVKHYEIQEPEKGKDEPTKIRIKIPGT